MIHLIQSAGGMAHGVRAQRCKELGETAIGCNTSDGSAGLLWLIVTLIVLGVAMVVRRKLSPE